MAALRPELCRQAELGKCIVAGWRLAVEIGHAKAVGEGGVDPLDESTYKFSKQRCIIRP